MRIQCGYSMGFAGTESEREEDIPQDIVDNGEEAIAEYIEDTHQHIFDEAKEKISIWVNITE